MYFNIKKHFFKRRKKNRQPCKGRAGPGRAESLTVVLDNALLLLVIGRAEALHGIISKSLVTQCTLLVACYLELQSSYLRVE